MTSPILYTFGPLQFQLWPLNVHEFDHTTGTAYARKEVVQAVPQREWVGEEDEVLQFRGRVYPNFAPDDNMSIGGFSALEHLDAIRRQATAQQLIRGGAAANVLGWFVIEKLSRHHENLDENGIGRLITFEVMFARCDTPDPAGYYLNVLNIIA